MQGNMAQRFYLCQPLSIILNEDSSSSFPVLWSSGNLLGRLYGAQTVLIWRVQSRHDESDDDSDESDDSGDDGY